MAKIKSVKFYNFTNLSGNKSMSFNAKFYDEFGKLIIIDVYSSALTKTSTYTETPEYIFSSNSSLLYEYHYNYAAFETTSLDLRINLNGYGTTWIPNELYATSDSWIKIEFKFPKYISDIKIFHSRDNERGFNTCSYDIEYENKSIETGSFISSGQYNPYGWQVMNSRTWDQNVIDSMFKSIPNFSQSKQIYDSEIGLIETLETNQFRNIPINLVETLKVLYSKPVDTYLNCLVSFNQKQSWKVFNGNSWIEISDTSDNNIILNGMDIEKLNFLNKDKLISGGFIGDLDFKIVMKTNDENLTPSISKIYIEYK